MLFSLPREFGPRSAVGDLREVAMFDYEAYDDSYASRIRGFLRDNPGGRWRLVVTVLLYLNVAVSLIYPKPLYWIFFPSPMTEDQAYQHLGAIFLLPCVAALLSFLLGRYFQRTWSRCNELTAEEAEAADPRPPILYLRPFKADRVRFVTEKMRVERARNVRAAARNARGGLVVSLIASAVAEVVVLLWAKGNAGGAKGESLFIEPLKALGPVIAIGRPGERIPPVGAARVYAKNDEWQGVVSKALDRAQLVIMFAGSTPGFLWELKHIFGRERFVPTLIILPFFQRYSVPEAVRFRALFLEASGLSLPAGFDSGRAIYVTTRLEFEVLYENPEESDMNFISPFLSSIVRAIDRGRPGYMRGCTGKMRERNGGTSSRPRNEDLSVQARRLATRPL
jgi:hypothetical protein